MQIGCPVKNPFRKRVHVASADTEAVIFLNARLQPMHRVSVFEDPLIDALDERGSGVTVTGGSTDYTPETGPQSCQIEIELDGDPDASVQLVIENLDALGAPVGSWVRIGSAAAVPFGVTHGFALSLDGRSLPDEVYETNDINDLIDALNGDLGDDAELQSWWEGSERTKLYYYARDADMLRSVLESAATKFPLARNSDVEPLTP